MIETEKTFCVYFLKHVLSGKTYIGSSNPFFGRKHSDDFKKLMSDKRSGIPNLRDSKPVSINGISYTSCPAASKVLGIPSITLRHRVLSKNKKFDSYSYIT